MAKPIIATRGPKLGRCNICGRFGKLTEDHTPPKGCIKIGQVQLQHIINHLNTDKPAGKGRLLQNGVKYRTLCQECNNTYLGTMYDPAFIKFVNTVGEYLKTTIALPKVIPTEIEPQKVIRSLIGHLSAQGVDRYDKGKDTEPIRDYFLDETLPLPSHIKVYYWLFPYKNHVMARDCAYLDLRVGEPCVIWFIKFFPIAFLVTFNEPKGLSFNVSELSRWRDKPINYKIKEYVGLEGFPHQFWPEAPTDHSVIMYGKEAIVSYRYRPAKKR